MSECFEEMGNEARIFQGDGKGNGIDLSQNAKKANSIIDVKVYKGCDSNLDWALKYARAGFEVLPLHYILPDGFCSCKGTGMKHEGDICTKGHPGKHPAYLVRHGVQDATTDIKKIERSWLAMNNANIGLRCNKFIAIDVDSEKGLQSILKLDKNNEIVAPDGTIVMDTPVAKTGREGYGRHILFKMPEGVIITGTTGFKPGLDCRSSGNYIIVAPSNHISGNKYEWIKSIFEYELQEIPKFLLDVLTSKKVEERLQKSFSSEEKIQSGERNATLCSFAGLLRNKGLGFEEIRDSLLSINKNRCDSPLDDSEVESIAQSVCRYPISQEITAGVKPDKSKNSMTVLINAIECLLNEEKEARLIFDSLGKPYLWIKIDGHFEMVELNEKNKTFKKFCFRLVLNKYGVTLKDDETFKNALLAIEVKAEDITIKKGFDVKSPVGYRRTWNNGAAWYDLCNKDWTGIEIDENGYRKASLPPIFLRRGSESPQVEPVFNAEPKEVNRLFKYSNVVDNNKKLLLKAWICASIVPMFKGLKLPQPILSFSGVTGSGKTALARFIKCIIDPAPVDVKSLPTDVEDLSVALNKNGMIVYDNIGSRMSQDISDVFCIATTKGYRTSRKLYTNDEESVLRLDSSIVFTSIHLDKMNDDLINRTIFIETSKFNKDQKRKRELILNEEFKKDLPYILGGIFASISEALKIYPSLDNLYVEDESIRMLDFAIFGEALSRVWGNKEMKFFEAYSNMQEIKTSEGINENTTLTTLVCYMKSTKEYYGPVSKLLQNLNDYYISSGIGTDTTYLISNPTSFAKKIKEMDGSLSSMGIEVLKDEIQTEGKTYYRIKYTRDDTQRLKVQSSIDNSEGW